MKSRAKAEFIQSTWLSLAMLSAGISIGQTAHASEIGLVSMWGAALLVWLSLSAQMKSKHEEIAEKVDAFRYRGLYPPKGQGSDEDVKRLKAAGEKGLALRLYLELHTVPIKEAKRAFNAL